MKIPLKDMADLQKCAEEYKQLGDVLIGAVRQAALGKGRERHANGRPFLEQPIMTVSGIVGPGFPLGQAMKKAGEAGGMLKRGEVEAAVQECLGAIVYLAAAILTIEASAQKQD